MILEIDGREIKSASDFHDKLMGCPGMPDFYGRNFYAFRDVLEGFIHRPFKIVWRHASISRDNLGKDFDYFIMMMNEIAKQKGGREKNFEYELIE